MTVIHHETNPHFIALITQSEDNYEDAVDGDCFEPVAYAEYRFWEYDVVPLKNCFTDDDMFSALKSAMNYFGEGAADFTPPGDPCQVMHSIHDKSSKVRRYMNIMHDTTISVHEYDRGTFYVLLNTPRWRKAVGTDKDSHDDGLWKALVNDEVYDITIFESPTGEAEDGEPVDSLSMVIGSDYAVEEATTMLNWAVEASNQDTLI